MRSRLRRRPESSKETDGEPLRAANALHFDPDLVVVTQKWAQLPDAVRAGILAMVNAAAPA